MSGTTKLDSAAQFDIAMGQVPSLPIIIAEWAINDRLHLQVSIKKFRGRELINIRKRYLTDDGAWCSCKQKVALQVKHLPQLAAAVNAALAVAAEMGIIGRPAIVTKPNPNDVIRASLALKPLLLKLSDDLDLPLVDTFNCVEAALAWHRKQFDYFLSRAEARARG